MTPELGQTRAEYKFTVTGTDLSVIGREHREQARKLHRHSSVLRQEQGNFCTHAISGGYHVATIRFFWLEQIIRIPCRDTVRGQFPAVRLQYR